MALRFVPQTTDYTAALLVVATNFAFCFPERIRQDTQPHQKGAEPKPFARGSRDFPAPLAIGRGERPAPNPGVCTSPCPRPLRLGHALPRGLMQQPRRQLCKTPGWRLCCRRAVARPRGGEGRSERRERAAGARAGPASAAAAGE